MNLFTSQQRGQVPVAPAWSQQTAANWEPSVATVGNLGGHTIDELLQFIETKWPFLFKIQKVPIPLSIDQGCLNKSECKKVTDC